MCIICKIKKTIIKLRIFFETKLSEEHLKKSWHSSTAIELCHFLTQYKGIHYEKK